MRKNELLNLNLSDIDHRVSRSLKYRYRTIRDLDGLTYEDLKRIRGCSIESVGEFLMWIQLVTNTKPCIAAINGRITILFDRKDVLHNLYKFKLQTIPVPRVKYLSEFEDLCCLISYYRVHNDFPKRFNKTYYNILNWVTDTFEYDLINKIHTGKHPDSRVYRDEFENYTNEY